MSKKYKHESICPECPTNTRPMPRKAIVFQDNRSDAAAWQVAPAKNNISKMHNAFRPGKEFPDDGTRSRVLKFMMGDIQFGVSGYNSWAAYICVVDIFIHTYIGIHYTGFVWHIWPCVGVCFVCFILQSCEDINVSYFVPQSRHCLV